MQALIELIAGFVAMLVAVALSQFGLNVDMPNKPDREIHRIQDCGNERSASVMVATDKRQHRC